MKTIKNIMSEKTPLNQEKFAGNLGNADFKKDYGIKYAYLSGAMYRGIASKELVVAMGQAGLMGFLNRSSQS